MSAAKRTAADATRMAATESGMAPTAAVTTTAAMTTSAMLRPRRYGQQQDERRNGHQATHNTNIISRFRTPGSGF